MRRFAYTAMLITIAINAEGTGGPEAPKTLDEAFLGAMPKKRVGNVNNRKSQSPFRRQGRG